MMRGEIFALISLPVAPLRVLGQLRAEGYGLIVFGS
jgi:hypothetical protein